MTTFSKSSVHKMRRPCRQGWLLDIDVALRIARYVSTAFNAYLQSTMGDRCSTYLQPSCGTVTYNTLTVPSDDSNNVESAQTTQTSFSMRGLERNELEAAVRSTPTLRLSAVNRIVRIT